MHGEKEKVMHPAVFTVSETSRRTSNFQNAPPENLDLSKKKPHAVKMDLLGAKMGQYTVNRNSSTKFSCENERGKRQDSRTEFML